MQELRAGWCPAGCSSGLAALSRNRSEPLASPPALACSCSSAKPAWGKTGQVRCPNYSGEKVLHRKRGVLMGSVLSEKMPLQRVLPSTQQEAAAVQTPGLTGEKLEGALRALSQRAAQLLCQSRFGHADACGIPLCHSLGGSQQNQKLLVLFTYLVIYFTDSFYFGGIWGLVVSFEAVWEYLHRSIWALRL